MAPSSTFATLPATPQTHLRLWFHAAAVQVASHVVDAGGPEVLTRFPFLSGYLVEAQHYLSEVSLECPTPEMACAWLDAVTGWEAALPRQAESWPLKRLRRAGLDVPHVLALMFAGLVEEDARFGALYSQLHPLPDEQHLTVGLLGDLLQPVLPHESHAGWTVARELVTRGLLKPPEESRPRAAWTLLVPGPIWDACRGERPERPAPGLRYLSPKEFAPIDALGVTLPDEVTRRLVRTPQLLRNGTVAGLLLRGMQGSGRMAALGSVARSLSQGVLLLEQPDTASLPAKLGLLGTLSTLYGAMSVIELELGPGEAVRLPSLPGYKGPLGLILGREGSLHLQELERCVTLWLPAPAAPARREYWKSALNGAVAALDRMDGVLDQISSRFHLTGGAIKQAGALAAAYAALDGRAHVELVDVQEACRSMNRQSLDSLAVRVDTGGAWDDLVVSQATREEMMNLAMRCRQREVVLGHLGPAFGAGMNRGVRALLSGSSGTGKTLAARILAAELGLDLYRVDLASVVSKYVGETERNLSRVFARAEEMDVILLFDEGDSLLTGRTDVRSANDRYANMETNYLLQRLESYEGIVVVTTNAAGRIDAAFQRRMDVHVEFTAPDASQRYRIWQLHLPTTHQVGDAFLRQAATRCVLTGGQIRNTALHASVLAVDSGEALSQVHLMAAVGREYRKLGARSPLGQGIG